MFIGGIYREWALKGDILMMDLSEVENGII
jgi:hypothetical protein